MERSPAADAEENLDAFERLARSRRSARHFRRDKVDRELVERLLRCAQSAPTSFNVQPVRHLVVQDESIRAALRHACMDQAQVEEAPVVVVFLGDRRAFAEHYEDVLQADLNLGAISSDYADLLRRNGRLMFDRSPLAWLWKALLVPIARTFLPIPEVPAVHQRFWLAKQVMLGVMNFLLAAEAAGLATLPMEGFDPHRLRKLLGLERSLEPILVVPLGYAAEPPQQKSRLPLASVTTWR